MAFFAVARPRSVQTVADYPVFWMFVAILVTFLVTRFVTRRIRMRGENGTPNGVVGDITIGGVHLHHQVFGIVLMTGAGLVLLAMTPEGSALDATAAVFGIGVGLAFDEFALWVHLRDVYWTDEGRQSVDAVFCVLVITGLFVGGATLVTGEVGTAAWWGSLASLLVTLLLCVVCMLKGKMITGVVGVVVVPVVMVGAFRLAKPNSWWARHRYGRRPQLQTRAAQRFGEGYEQRWNRWRDLVGGAPSR